MLPVLFLCTLRCQQWMARLRNVGSHLNGDKAWPGTQPCDPPLLAPSFPQDQGLKANNSQELSMCFTEVSEGHSAGGCRG